MQVDIAVLDEILEDLEGVHDAPTTLMPEDLLEDDNSVLGFLFAFVNVLDGVEDGLDVHLLTADHVGQDVHERAFEVVGVDDWVGGWRLRWVLRLHKLIIC